MSEELENSVREMLKEETWTRTAISNFNKNSLVELAKILEKARNEGSENSIKEICDEQLAHSKDSIIALYLSGMIALRTGSLDNSALIILADILEKNHKEALVESLCETILENDKTNRFALRKLAEYYKANNDDRLWETYEAILANDEEEADIAKILAERYESQNSIDTATKYYKKALLRYINQKNYNAVKEMWAKLLTLIPDDIDWFLSTQRKVSKHMSEDKAALLLHELYAKIVDINLDSAIDILKLILKIDQKDDLARRLLIECFRKKYQDHKNVEDYIKLAGFNLSGRSIFESISDFEKHVSFDAGSYVFHRTWGVGIIRKVEGQNLTINFGKKAGVKTMSLSMATSALQPLSKDHIWVKKATKKKEVLAAEVKENVAEYLKCIIKSFGNSCDDKRIKAELVPAILTTGEWTSWHAKAQKILATDMTFGVNPNDINMYIVRDKELTPCQRLSNEFRAEKDFFSRIDIISRFVKDENADTDEETFADMLNYFNSYIKAFSDVDEQVLASYLTVQRIAKEVPDYPFKPKFSFAELYGEIENPREMYSKLKDTKNTSLKSDFLDNIRNLPDWDTQFIRLFPTVLDKNMISVLNASGHLDKVQRLVQDSFNEYRNYRDCAIYLFKECRKEEWYINAGISYEKQLVTLINIVALCYREINNHVNTTDNKKTIKNATTLLFEEKGENGEKINNMMAYMLSNSQEVITRMYTMVNDVKDLDPMFKAQLRNGILSKYPDFKFQEAEIKQEAPKGLMVTAKMLEIKKALAEDIEKVQLPKIAEEVSEAREKGDLKENAEYQSAKEAQRITNIKLTKLKEGLARAVVFDPTTVTTSIISFGTTVTLLNNNTNQEETYTILGPWESETYTDQGIISYLAPFGDKLLNAKAGETLNFVINGNANNYTVKTIQAAKF